MYLRLFILGLLIWFAWRWWHRAHPPTPTKPPKPGLQNMVRCAHCGLHVPEQEAVSSDGRFYCSTQHRLEAGH